VAAYIVLPYDVLGEISGTKCVGVSRQVSCPVLFVAFVLSGSWSAPMQLVPPPRL
jgi:hypothetical protein